MWMGVKRVAAAIRPLKLLARQEISIESVRFRTKWETEGTDYFKICYFLNFCKFYSFITQFANDRNESWGIPIFAHLLIEITPYLPSSR